MWFFVLVSVARAHIPHSIVTGVAVPTAEPDLPWLLATQCEAPTAIYRSLDRGSTWEPVGSPAMVDDMTDGAYTDEGLGVLLGEDRYFWTADATSWGTEDLTFSPTLGGSSLAGGDQLYFATTDGVMEVPVGGAPVQALAGVAIESVFEGDDGPVAITSEGRVWWRRDGVWTALLTAPLGTAFAGTSSEGRVWVGTNVGSVFTWSDAGWETCGDVPLGAEDSAHREITRLDAREGRLLVIRADEGPAISLDGCATFSASLAPNHNDWPEDRLGAYTTAERAWVSLVGVGHTLFAAGYDGASVSEDDGASWHIAPIVGADYTEGIAFSPTFNDDGEALLAVYGSGITRVHAWGAALDAPGLDFRASNGQSVAIASDAVAVSPGYAVFNTSPFFTADAGASWSALTGPFEAVRRIQTGPGARIYGLAVTSTEGAPGSVVVSEDHGATWSTFTNLPSALATDTANSVVDRPGWLCLAGNQHVACSADGGSTWSTVHTVASPEARVQSITAWPDDVPERLLISDSLGLYTYDGAEVQVRDATTPSFPLLATADDGHVYAIDLTGHLFESANGGDTWTDTTVAIPTQTRVLVPRPDFALHPDLLLGTLDGAYVVRGTTVTRFANYQRVDDGAQFLMCEACTTVEDAAAVLNEHSDLAVNSWVEGNLRGTSLRIVGASITGAVVRLTLDGVDLGTSSVTATTDITTTLLRLDGLEDGWHRLNMRVEVGAVSLDALEGEGPSTVLDGPPTDTGDTGVDSGDTGETGVDSGDSGGSTDTGDSGETAVDSGSGPDTADDTGKADTTGCGCASGERASGGAAPSGYGAALFLAGLAIRARRRPAPPSSPIVSDAPARSPAE